MWRDIGGGYSEEKGTGSVWKVGKEETRSGIPIVVGGKRNRNKNYMTSQIFCYQKA